MFANSSKICNKTKMLKTPEELVIYFPGFLSFVDSTEQQMPIPVDKERRKTFYSGKKKKHTVKNQIMVNNHGYILHKVCHKAGKIYDYDVYRKNHPVTPKEVVNVFDLGYLGEKKIIQNKNHLYHVKKREILNYIYKKKIITKIILERE